MENQSATKDSPPTIRIGEQYQALIPDLIGDRALIKPDHATLVWSPIEEDEEENLGAYVTEAKLTHDYSEEQALALLLWHKHDIENARSDLPNFTPFNLDFWSEMDKLLFEEGCKLFGNDFETIQERKLPEKSIGELINHYYKTLREHSPKHQIRKSYSLRSRSKT